MINLPDFYTFEEANRIDESQMGSYEQLNILKGRMTALMSKLDDSRLIAEQLSALLRRSSYEEAKSISSKYASYHATIANASESISKDISDINRRIEELVNPR